MSNEKEKDTTVEVKEKETVAEPMDKEKAEEVCARYQKWYDYESDHRQYIVEPSDVQIE